MNPQTMLTDDEIHTWDKRIEHESIRPEDTMYLADPTEHILIAYTTTTIRIYFLFANTQQFIAHQLTLSDDADTGTDSLALFALSRDDLWLHCVQNQEL